MATHQYVYKVDHGILLHKLRDFGISGKLGIWLHSLLLNRSQFVRIPGGFSTDSQVISGVPQGTVLGPLILILIDNWQDSRLSITPMFHSD